MVFKSELEDLLTKMKKRSDFVNKQISAMREGRLLITRRGNGTEYFQEQYIKGKRIRRSIGKDRRLVAELACKQYMIVQLDLLDENILLVESILSKFVEPSHENIRARLTGRLAELPDSMFAEKTPWRNSYNQSSYMPEARIHTTSRGLKVRSKSELLIAEKFYEYEVQFRYEEILQVGKHVLVPDFTVRRRDGKMFYWEHCGRTHDRQYIEHHHWKMNLYEGVGIVPWDNLIVTYDNEAGSINLAVAEAEIRTKLLV